MDVPTRACILDKMLRAFTYITSNVERLDICISGYVNKISITKMAYVIYVASCFWSRVKPRGHCIRYRNIYSRFSLLFALTFLRSSLGGEIASKKRICRSEKTLSRGRRCARIILL